MNQKDAENTRKQIDMLRMAGMTSQADLIEREFKKKLAQSEIASNAKKPSLKAEEWLSKLITQDERMESLKQSVRLLIPHDDAVLIIGESGTGKELIARALHGDRSETDRQDLGKFIAINCAGMPPELFESEMFGHKKGAFSGADSDKIGLMEEAKDGTLFLDEIGDMPLLLQAKLLRAIQQKEIRQVGSNITRRLFCRIVAATHHDLAKLVGEGKFRLDLYARLVTFPLITIPIRERKGDIKLIVDSLDKTHTCYDKCGIDWLNSEQTYPLNVRDLQRIVRQYEVLGKVL